MSTKRLTPSLLHSATIFDRTDDRSPGPAAYNTQRSMMSSQSFTFSSRHKDLTNSNPIGPNHYTPGTAKKVLEHQTPSFSMRSRVGGTVFESTNSHDNQAQSPAQYSYTLSTLSGCSSSIGQRTKQIDKRIYLSPTKYNALPAFHALNRSKASCSLKSKVSGAFDMSHDQIDAPGPSKSDLRLQTLQHTGTKFSRDSNRFTVKQMKCPSVGSYNLDKRRPEWTNAPEFTLKGRVASGEKLFV